MSSARTGTPRSGSEIPIPTSRRSTTAASSPRQVAHEGPSLKDIKTGTPPLFERVSNWLQSEIPDPPLPNTGPLSVAAGFNSVPLDAVASNLSGARLTFLATDLSGVLSLTALKIQAPSTSNVHLDSPFFVILPRSGKVNADPEVNGFKGELTVPAGTTADLFTGKMILLRWDSTGQLKIVFQKIDGTPGEGGTNPDCNALAVFNSQAVPAMGMQVEEIDPYDGGGVLGNQSCVGCHTDPGNYPSAVNAMDLQPLSKDPAAACRNARAWINFANKDQSQILENPTGGMGNPFHPMKPIAADDPIVVGIKAWVEAEQP
jgi:hypothetical protein